MLNYMGGTKIEKANEKEIFIKYFFNEGIR